MDRTAATVGSFTVSGRAIITGALTTAIAFFALVVAESDLVRELGIVAGVGIASELFAMLLIVPALLGMRAARLDLRNRRPRLTRNRTRPSLVTNPTSAQRGLPLRSSCSSPRPSCFSS